MQCRYCQHWNEEDERRCVRCGRRLHLSSQAASDNFSGAPAPLATATAPAFESIPGGNPLPKEIPQRPSYQPSLFRDAVAGQSVSGPKVIPIPTLTPVKPAESDARRRPRQSNPRHHARRTADSQQSLDFYPAQTNAHPMGTQVQAVIYCDAPVALPMHRLIAAAFDLSMVLIGLGVFLSIFFLCGGTLMLTKQSAPFLISVAALLTLFYRFLWVFANGDSPGMRFAGLRLVNFDGRSPDRDQRAFRQISSLLSLLSAGLGLVWALVDEENLAWHDHISKTFPTPG